MAEPRNQHPPATYQLSSDGLNDRFPSQSSVETAIQAAACRRTIDQRGGSGGPKTM